MIACSKLQRKAEKIIQLICTPLHISLLPLPANENKSLHNEDIVIFNWALNFIHPSTCLSNEVEFHFLFSEAQRHSLTSDTGHWKFSVFRYLVSAAYRVTCNEAGYIIIPLQTALDVIRSDTRWGFFWSGEQWRVSTNSSFCSSQLESVYLLQILIN